MTQPQQGGAPECGSRGQPSQGLVDSGALEGGSGQYDPITEAASEVGEFTLIGGYVDDAGVVHRDVKIRSMSGDEEDMLGNRSIHILERVGSILGSCIERLGTITDKGQIAQAVNRFPMGTRTHALICLRRTTHWKRNKDIYTMDVRCPVKGCEKIGSYAVNLAELDTHDMPQPEKRLYDLKLQDSGHEIQWRVATTPQERVLEVVSDMSDESRVLTFGAVVRLETIDGRDVRLGLGDMLTADKKKLKLSKRAEDLFGFVRKLSVGDREDIRTDIADKEPYIDTDLDFECTHCHRPFKGGLDIGQDAFFFPSTTSKRSKMKSST